LKEVYNEALNVDKERKKLGFSTQFEFAVYELLLQSLKNDEKASRDLTNAIFTKVKEETEIVGWKSKRSFEKKMNTAIYDILSENKNCIIPPHMLHSGMLVLVSCIQVTCVRAFGCSSL
jgi:hypothetical protein